MQTATRPAQMLRRITLTVMLRLKMLRRITLTVMLRITAMDVCCGPPALFTAL
jgi:hypothetical protein